MSCGGGGGGGNDEALDYQKQQDRIDENRRRRGQAMVDALFDGGKYATGRAEEVDLGQTYYDAQGNVVYEGGSVSQPEHEYETEETGNPDDVGTDYRDPDSGKTDEQINYEDTREDLQEKIERHNLYTGVEEREGYDDEFFEQRADAYLDYANPRIDEQRGEAAEELAYGLARSGLGQSSVAADRRAQMGDTYEGAREQAAREAQRQVDEARKQAANQRQQLRPMVDDPQALSSELPGVADALSALQTPEQSPVGPVFQGLTAGLGAGVSAQKTASARQRIIDKYGGNSPTETSPHSG